MMLLSRSSIDALVKGPRLPQPWEVLMPRFPNEGRNNYEGYKQADNYSLSPQHQSTDSYPTTPSIVVYRPEPKSYDKPEKSQVKPEDALAKPELPQTYKKKSLDSYFTPSENNSFKSVVDSYQNGAGKELREYLQSQGRSYMPVSGVSTASLPQSTLAAVVTDGKTGVLVGSNDFAYKVSRFARRYGIGEQTAERYVLDHEHWHLSQSPAQLSNTFLAESDVESGLAKFYQSMAGKNPKSEYAGLASIASRRISEIGRNYALN